jgi:hypothetical protein
MPSENMESSGRVTFVRLSLTLWFLFRSIVIKAKPVKSIYRPDLDQKYKTSYKVNKIEPASLQQSQKNSIELRGSLLRMAVVRSMRFYSFPMKEVPTDIAFIFL